MKKQLLSMLLLAAGIGSAYADNHSVGDYIYTPNGRFKVQSENLISNGDFADGTITGLTSINGTQPTDTFTVETGAGPNGQNVINVAIATGSQKGDNKALSTNLHFKTTAESGKHYVVTYKVKGFGGSSTTSGTNVDGRNTNYQSVFINEDGNATGSNKEFPWLTYGEAWTTVTYDIASDTDGFLNLVLYNMQANHQFTDFGVYEVTQVNDDRLLKDAIAQIQYFQDNKDLFPSEQDLLDEPLGDLQNALNSDMEAEEQAGTISGIFAEDGPVTYFLKANGADVSSYFTNFTFDNVATIAANKGAASGWTTQNGSVGRSGWGIEAPVGNFTTNHVYKQFQAYNVNSSSSTNLAEGWYYQTKNLPAGKYLYTVMAQAHQYYQDGRGGSSTYTYLDYSNQYPGAIKFFINGDTVTIDSVPTTRGLTVNHVFDVKEDGDKTIGFYVGATDNYRNGCVRLDNVNLILLGQTDEDVQGYFYKASVADAANALKVMVDSANVVCGKSEYIYGKEILKAVAAEGQATYDAFVAQYDKESVDTLNAEMKIVRSAIQAHYNTNSLYTTLAASIASAEEAYADADRTTGKDALNAALTTAKGIYEGITAKDAPDAADSTALQNGNAAIVKAVNDFYAANAGYASAGDMSELIVNPNFASNGSGWVVTNDTDSKQVWKYGSDSNFKGGKKIYAYRGKTTAPKNKAVQTISVDYNGLYVFKFQAYAYSDGGCNGNAEDPMPVWFTTQVGENGKIDSVNIKTSAFEPQWFEARTIVTGAPTTITFGLDALENHGLTYEADLYNAWGHGTYANGYGYGGNELYYYGDYAKYVADSTAAAIAPTRDSLQKVVDAANALKGSVRNPNNVDTSPFTTAIAEAQAAVNNANVTLEALNAQFPMMEEATNAFLLSGVWPAEGTSFDLSFAIKNPKFNDEADAYAGWTITGDTLTIGADGYLYRYNNLGRVLNVRYEQTVENLPAGAYSFGANESWRTSLAKTSDNVTDFSYYLNIDREPGYVYVVANGDSTAASCVLSGGKVNDANDTWTYDNGEMLTYYSYTHTPSMTGYFDKGMFLNEVLFNVGSDKKATIAMSAVDAPMTSQVYMRGPQLLFWGDNAQTGIEGINAGNNVINVNAAVYNLIGVKVANSRTGLAKGLYIQNGKKFVVK